MGGGGGAGRGGPEGGAERLHDAQLQQQIVVALRRLREDMRSVMERLEAVEHLAAAHVGSDPSGLKPCPLLSLLVLPPLLMFLVLLHTATVRGYGEMCLETPVAPHKT